MAKKKTGLRSGSPHGVKRILSIDGGGIRGIIPAMVLAEVERQAKKPICELFDLLVGTSTGGIIALALTAPGREGKPKYTARQVASFYEQHGKDIFNRTVWHSIHSGWGLREEKYPSKGIERVLDDYFGAAQLRDALADVFVTAYALERRMPFFFRSSRAKDDPTYDFPMKDAARATSAAPTYFEPLKLQAHPDDPEEYYALVDGGVYANNPAMCACAEAKVRWPNSQLFMLSLGTGELTRRIPYDVAKKWGLVEWVKPVLDIVFDGMADTVNFQVKQLLNKNFHRYQVKLNIGNDDMDDASRSNIHNLKMLTKELLQEESQSIAQLCEKLQGLAQ